MIYELNNNLNITSLPSKIYKNNNGVVNNELCKNLCITKLSSVMYSNNYAILIWMIQKRYLILLDIYNKINVLYLSQGTWMTQHSSRFQHWKPNWKNTTKIQNAQDIVWHTKKGNTNTSICRIQKIRKH